MKMMERFRLVLVSVAAVMALLTALPAQADQGDSFFTFEYRYGSTQDIPGAENRHGHGHPSDTQETADAALGFSLSHWLKDDLSVDFRAWVPSGDAGTDTVSGSLGLDYFFGHVYLPLNVGYDNELDSLTFGSGIGVHLPVGSKIAIRGDLGLFYLDDADLEDRTAWKAGLGLGFGF